MKVQKARLKDKRKTYFVSIYYNGILEAVCIQLSNQSLKKPDEKKTVRIAGLAILLYIKFLSGERYVGSWELRHTVIPLHTMVGSN